MSDSSAAVPVDDVLSDVVIRVRDHGPAPVRLPSADLIEPWCRFEAELPSYPLVCERGVTPWEAVYRLVANHRSVLERRWSPAGLPDGGV
jgi:hypothetical protein